MNRVLLNILEFGMETSHCECHKHAPAVTADKGRNAHLIQLLQNNFLSPYKILHLLDPLQADHFKKRNQSSGCCSSNHITIPTAHLTHTQSILKDLTSYSALSIHMDAILSQAQVRFQNVLQSGKKDKLVVDGQVEKFLLDRVLGEVANQYVYTQLLKITREKADNLNKEVGLWATPVSWKQKYPHIELNSIPSANLGQLFNKDKGWTVLTKYFANEQQVGRELQVLEKDGRFEEVNGVNTLQGKTKVLANPQTYCQMTNSNLQYSFAALRQVMITLSSFPFELNSKANLFCTVSPNTHIIYSPQPLAIKQPPPQLQFTVLVNFGKSIQFTVGAKTGVLPMGSLALLRSEVTYGVEGEGGVFLVRNFIGRVGVGP